MTTKSDPEAIAREILRLDADRSAAEPQGDFLDYMVALRKTAPTAPDVEATLRAENATLKESLERALVCLYGADATLDDARKVSTVEAALRAELDAARAEVERLRDIIRHNAPVVVGVCSPMVNAELDKRDAEIARLTAEVDRMTALYRKADDGHDENMRETARLIGEVERLTARERDARPFVEQGDVDPDGDVRCFECCNYIATSHGAEMPHAPDCARAAWLAGCKTPEAPTC